MAGKTPIKVPDTTFREAFPSLVLPAITVSLTSLGYVARMTRASTIDVLRTDYVRAADLKGLPRSQVLVKHVLRNALLPTVTVVTTTMIINVLKVFDIVFVMTNGLNGTEVIANRMFKFIVTNQGRSMAIAVLLILLTVPVLIYNVRRFREQEMMR